MEEVKTNDVLPEDDDYTADVEDEAEVDTEDEDDGIEYDDDGNMIFDDDEAEEEGDTTHGTDEEGEEPAEEPEKTQESDPEPTPDPTPSNADFERLRKDLALLRGLSSDALKKLGYDDEDPVKALIKAAAEAEGISAEEYEKQFAEKMQKEDVARAERSQRAEAIKAQDLAAIQAEFPFAKKYTKVEDFPNFQEFGEMRLKGLSPEKAFRASHGKEIDSSVAAAVAHKDSKAHLTSSVPKATKDTSIKMTSAEMRAFRELFPGATDKQIYDYYKKAKS